MVVHCYHSYEKIKNGTQGVFGETAKKEKKEEKRKKRVAPPADQNRVSLPSPSATVYKEHQTFGITVFGQKNIHKLHWMGPVPN